MRHHSFLRDVQWKSDVTVEVGHKNQSSADTCSQLLFSLLSASTKVGGDALREVLQKLSAVRGDLSDRVVEEIEWITFHSVLNRFETQLHVSAIVSLCSVPQVPEVAASGSSLVGSCTVRNPLSSWLFLKVDLVKREYLIGFLGRDFHPAYLRRDSPVRPCNQPLEAGLALVCSLNVGLSTVVTLDLLHFKFCAVNVVFCISGSLGLPSRAASFSPCLSSTFPFSNSLGVRQGTKGSHPESHLIFNGARRSLAASRQWRQLFWRWSSLHLSWAKGPSTLEVLFHVVPGLGIRASCQRISLRCVPFLVLLHPGVVAQPRDLKGSVYPGKLPIDRVIAANEVFIGHPVRTDDCFIGPEKTAAALNDKFGIKSQIVLLTGSRSRELFAANWVSRPMGAKR